MSLNLSVSKNLSWFLLFSIGLMCVAVADDDVCNKYSSDNQGMYWYNLFELFHIIGLMYNSVVIVQVIPNVVIVYLL